MSKHNKDWRNPDGYDDSFIRDEKPNRKPSFGDGSRPKRKEVPADPTAVSLAEITKNQILDFLAAPVEERVAASEDLFYVGDYPANLVGFEGCENYLVYQLDRMTRVNRDDPANLRRLSTMILVVNKETMEPAYTINAYITPTLAWNVTVLPFDENGPIYRMRVILDSRRGN